MEEKIILLRKVQRERVKGSCNNKKLIGLTIGVFIVCALALNFVDVSPEITGHVTAADSLKNIFSGGEGFLSKWVKGELDITVLKYVSLILLTCLIFSILSAASWPEKILFRWVIAIFISFIGVGFVLPSELYAIFTTYGSLALTLLTILPLVIMFFFSTQVLQGKLTVGRIMLQLLGWYFYLAFLIYLMISSLWKEGTDINSIFILLILCSGIAVSLIIVFNKTFRHWVRTLGREISEEVTDDVVAARSFMNRIQQA